MPGILLDKTTYFVGDEINIQIDFINSADLLRNATNINIDIFRVDIERNNFAFGFGVPPLSEDNVVNVSKKLPENFQTGLYVVSGIKLIYEEDGQEIRSISVDDPQKCFFWVSNNEMLDESGLYEKVSELESARNRYVNAEILTAAAIGGAQCE